MLVKRFLLALLSSFFIINTLWANDLTAKQIEEAIKNSPLKDQAQISISVRNVQNEQIIYEKDAKVLLHPASTLKAFTSAMALDYLGPSYDFETAFYKIGQTYYLKLSADPLMDEKTLSMLISQLQLKEITIINDLLIDDSAIDDKRWGIGWMWDDNTNYYMPQITAYNLNHNLLNIQITPKKNKTSSIEIFPCYPVQIIDQLKNSAKTDIKIDRNIFVTPDTITLSGEIAGPTSILVPALNPQRYFVFLLEKTFNMYSIAFNPEIKNEKVPFVASKVVSVKHNIKEILNAMDKESDNLAAEVILKRVGAKYSNKTGSTEDGLEVFKQYYKKLGLDTSEIKVVDGSGISHNDLLNSDWMTFALSKISKNKYFDIYLNSLASPLQDGTLKNRLPELKDNLHAKTGSIAGVSALTGYLTTNSGQKICFAILIQNFKGESTDAKNLEDSIMRIIYNS
ncbi:MAG: D-alanyl-D-alanine carboxypeptidase/D-alanyl-D-alanine-endopeptidase [Candidatus Gastranaerophilaceae bacterium]|jgi:D-alanyl-D-alanine carboxypeptidase/D-alanyl-D-alanine-endopeptidase (penicillin-binding protein 4)